MAKNDQQNSNPPQEDIGRLVQVRIDKLKELQSAGKDPFEIVRYDQSHHSSDVRERFDELEIVLTTDAEGKTQHPAWEEIPAEKRISGFRSFTRFHAPGFAGDRGILR